MSATNEGLRLDTRVPGRGLDLRLAVEPGTVHGLVGPNGSGKSTIIELVSGQLRPGSGTVTWRGEVLSGPGVHVPIHRRRFALLAQRPTLFGHLSVLENVAFGLRATGAAPRPARARALAELEQCGLADLAGRRAPELSGGQAQRVCLARALATDPGLVLLDEPFTGLDATAAAQMRDLLGHRLHGRTALLVTHEPLDLWQLTDRVTRLAGGRADDTINTRALFALPTDRAWAQLAGVNLLRPPGDSTAPGVVVDPAELVLERLEPHASDRPVVDNRDGRTVPGTVVEVRGQGAALWLTVELDRAQPSAHGAAAHTGADRDDVAREGVAGAGVERAGAEAGEPVRLRALVPLGRADGSPSRVGERVSVRLPQDAAALLRR